jgi:uncharacterized protein with FMN-binding domain
MPLVMPRWAPGYPRSTFTWSDSPGDRTDPIAFEERIETMRRIAIAVMSTISGLVLLFSYHTSLNSGGFGGGSATTLAEPSTLPAGPAAAVGASPAAATSGKTGSSAKTAAGKVSGTFTGDVTDTRWGPVQVQIVVKNSKIVTATAVVFPNGNGHDQEINAYAIPQLQQATVAAGSANFDSVSGATVTSDGYKGSLQSALDKAHL